MAVGTFTMCLAQFASPVYNPTGYGYSGSNLTGVCVIGDEVESIWDDDTKKTEAGLKRYLALLIIGQMLNGYCSACIYSLGFAFLEISSPAAQSALYVGIFTSGSVVGPGIGFLGGSRFLDIWVDFPRPPPEGLNKSDPAWVGAWWMGFLLSSILCLIFALLMFLFPAELPETDAIRKAKVCEAHDNGTEEKINELGFGTSLAQIPKATWYLFRNPCYVCITIVDSIELGIVVGLATFTAKLLVVQFNLNPSGAAILGGVLGIPSAVIGQLGGGILIKKWDLSLPQMLKLALGSSSIAACCVFVYLARCPDIEFAGVNTAYLKSETFHSLNLSSACNEGCECNTAFYNPVCANGVQYFSPCHAGCTEQPIVTADNERVYQGCACPLQLSGSVVNATHGKCEVQCKLLYTVFVPFVFLMTVATFAMVTPMTLATIRVVPVNLRTYGLAIHGLFLRLLGSIPVPLLFGAMFDASCAIWQDKNGEQGSCWMYDNKALSIRVVVLMFSLKVISLIFHIVSLVLYKPPASDSEASSVDGEIANSCKLNGDSADSSAAKENEAYVAETTDM